MNRLTLATFTTAVAFTALVYLPAVSGDYILIPALSEWKYDDTGTDLLEAWREVAYDDSAWASGPGPLGYGDGDETTVVSFGDDEANKNPTVYFRKTVEVYDEASTQTVLQFRAQWDDGIVCYVNNVQAIIGNVPSPTLYTSLAFSGIGNVAQERNYNVRPADSAAKLVEGVNVIACEVHQADVDSSDLRFDAIVEVLGVEQPSPTPSPIPPSATPSISESPSPTISDSASVTVTPTVTPTASESFIPPSSTPTPTPTPISESATVSVTPSGSLTPTPTSSFGSSPSNSPTRTPTISVTPSVSRTPSVTPSISPSISITPTVSITPTSSPSKGSFEATGCYCSCENLGCCGQVDADIRNRCAAAAGTGDTDMWLVMASAGAILVVGCCVTSAVWVQMRQRRQAEQGGRIGEPGDYSKFKTSELLAAHAAALTAATNLAKAKDGNGGDKDNKDSSSNSGVLPKSRSGDGSDLDSENGGSPGPRRPGSRLSQHHPDSGGMTPPSWPPATDATAAAQQPVQHSSQPMSYPAPAPMPAPNSRPASVTVDLTSQQGGARTPTPDTVVRRGTPPPMSMGPSSMPQQQQQQQQQPHPAHMMVRPQSQPMMQPQAVWVPSPTHGVASNPMFNPAQAGTPYWAVRGPAPQPHPSAQARALAAAGIPVQRGVRRVRKVKKVRKKKPTGMFEDSSDEDGSAWSGLGVNPKF